MARTGSQLPCYRNGKQDHDERTTVQEASELWMEYVGNEKSFLQEEEEMVIQDPHENEEGNQPLLLALQLLLH